MSEDYWDVPGNAHLKLKLSDIAGVGFRHYEFVVLKWQKTDIPQKHENAVNYYLAHPGQWPQAEIKKDVLACRLWLKAGPPEAYDDSPFDPEKMYMLDLVFATPWSFDRPPCVVEEFGIAFPGYDMQEDEEEEWADLIAKDLQKMPEDQKRLFSKKTQPIHDETGGEEHHTLDARGHRKTPATRDTEQPPPEKRDVSKPCETCGWIHDETGSKWTNPHTQESYTFNATKKRAFFLLGLCDGMRKSGDDVLLSIAQGLDKSQQAKPAKDVLGKERVGVFYLPTTPGRGKIKSP